MTFNDVRIRLNTNDRKPVESSASLMFDDTSRKVLVESGQKRRKSVALLRRLDAGAAAAAGGRGPLGPIVAGWFIVIKQ